MEWRREEENDEDVNDRFEKFFSNVNDRFEKFFSVEDLDF